MMNQPTKKTCKRSQKEEMKIATFNFTNSSAQLGRGDLKDFVSSLNLVVLLVHLRKE